MHHCCMHHCSSRSQLSSNPWQSLQLRHCALHARIYFASLFRLMGAVPRSASQNSVHAHPAKSLSNTYHGRPACASFCQAVWETQTRSSPCAAVLLGSKPRHAKPQICKSKLQNHRHIPVKTPGVLCAPTASQRPSASLDASHVRGATKSAIWPLAGGLPYIKQHSLQAEVCAQCT